MQSQERTAVLRQKDEIMGEFFGNKWTKRAISLLSPLYCVIIVMLSYLSIFYDMTVRNPVTVCVLLSAISLIATVIMLYTRKQLITILTSLVMLPALLPAVLLYFGHWEVLIPLLVVSLIIFFFSGLGETPKTAFGTVFLLMYLLGSLGYFLLTSLFAPSTVSTVVESGMSPSGTYRYTVVNTMDSSEGSTTVSIESNLLDKDYDMLLFRIRGLSRDVMVTRPMEETTAIVWQTEQRADITKYLNSISQEINVTLSDQQMELLGRTAYYVTYNNGQSLQLSGAEFNQLKVTLSADDQAALKIYKEEVLVSALDEESLSYLGMTVTNYKNVQLSTLTDDELAKLGIPEEGDVLYCNGKVCFRYYIAILEEYFDISKQEIGLA